MMTMIGVMVPVMPVMMMMMMMMMMTTRSTRMTMTITMMIPATMRTLLHPAAVVMFYVTRPRNNKQHVFVLTTLLQRHKTKDFKATTTQQSTNTNNENHGFCDNPQKQPQTTGTNKQEHPNSKTHVSFTNTTQKSRSAGCWLN